MSEVIFIGSNPSQAAQSNGAFDRSTKSGKMLHEWINRANVGICALYNLVSIPTPGNRPLNTTEIKNSLPRLENIIMSYRDAKVIAVGKTAAKALTLLRIPFYEMPHPSGLNRLLNDPQYIEEKINGLKNYLSPSKIE